MLHKRQQVLVSRWLSQVVRVVRLAAEWCAAVATSTFRNICSWRQQARTQRSRRRFADPLPANTLYSPHEEILSGYEEGVSFIRDGFTTWVKADFSTILERHVVDVRKALAEFREASVRRHDTSAQEYYFDSSVPNRSSVQKRLSIYNWNPGPRRGREGAVEKQIAGKWHVITLQEAIEYVDNEIFTNRFHVTHYGGCAVLFNKDTFCPDVKVKSIYRHDIRCVLPDKVVEGDSGWVLEGVLSRASFRRQPPSGQKTFTVYVLAHQ